MYKSQNTINTKIENCVIVGIFKNRKSEHLNSEHLDELEFLALTARAKVKKRFTQQLEGPNPKTLIGSGKIQEIKEYVNKKKN